MPETPELTITTEEVLAAIREGHLITVKVAVDDRVPEELRHAIADAVHALCEEAADAAAAGRSIVWLVARVPLDTDVEDRAELVRRAAAVLAGFNDPAMAQGPVKAAEPLT